MKIQINGNEIDRLIVTGQIPAARAAITAGAARAVPRAGLAPLAGLAWRAGLEDVGLKLLHGVLRPRGNGKSDATPVERAEYAQCLMRAGASDEAERLLSTVSPGDYPRALLYRASVEVSRWAYPASIPFIESYLRTPGLDDYQRLIATCNLAAARIWDGHHADAAEALGEVLATGSRRGYHPLVARALGLIAESHFAERRWDLARKFLREAEERLALTGARDAFVLRKYGVAFDYLERGDADALGRLLALRSDAMRSRLWETVRDCDRFLALRGKDHTLFTHLYFGTPFDEYKRKLLEDFSGVVPPPLSSYRWNPLHGGEPQREIDLLTGALEDGRAGLVPGSVPHRILVALASDFYRPLRVAELYSRIYPARYFNPHSSPGAVHQSLRRLRVWLAGERLPLEVVESGAEYSLTAKAPVALRLTATPVQGKRYSPWVERLRHAFTDTQFSVGEAKGRLDVPLRTVQRTLACAVEEGDLIRRGRGNATRYTFPAHFVNKRIAEPTSDESEEG